MTLRRADILYPKLSYVIVGLLFEIHRERGHYCREKQYADALEQKLIALEMYYQRELKVGGGNRLDFVIDNKIVLELKTKTTLSKNDYIQTQRYLQASSYKLALLINFRRKHLSPKRVIRVSYFTEYNSQHSH